MVEGTFNDNIDLLGWWVQLKSAYCLSNIWIHSDIIYKKHWKTINFSHCQHLYLMGEDSYLIHESMYASKKTIYLYLHAYSILWCLFVFIFSNTTVVRCWCFNNLHVSVVSPGISNVNFALIILNCFQNIL